MSFFCIEAKLDSKIQNNDNEFNNNSNNNNPKNNAKEIRLYACVYSMIMVRQSTYAVNEIYSHILTHINRF